MLTNITSLTGNGLKDWFIQRVSAIYFAVYVLFIVGFLIAHPQLQYDSWSQLFHCGIFKIATALALLMVLLHEWIGIWTVTTDYINGTQVRLTVQLLILLLLLGQFIWGLNIVWGQ